MNSIRFFTKVPSRSFSYGPLDSAARYKKRLELLSKIYEPFSQLENNSPEYIELAKSGTVWSNHFKPFEWNESDLAYFTRNQHIFSDIDGISKSQPLQSDSIMRSLSVEMTHQSVQIEGNKLQISDTAQIFENLTEYLAKADLIRDKPPTAKQVLPGKNEMEVLEIRNHLIAQHYALQLILRPITEAELRTLHYLMLQDTKFAQTTVWTKRIRAGEYRPIVVQAHNHELTIYPYPLEIHELMKQLITFLNAELETPAFHPIMSAIKVSTIFLHIHPFFDGNGRVGRLLMAVMMLKYGLFPVVFQNMDRDSYINSIAAYQQGNREPLYDLILNTVYDMIYSQIGD